MELEQARKRVQELRETIEYHSALYYDEDAPTISDFEYDTLTRELRALEERMERNMKFEEIDHMDPFASSMGGMGGMGGFGNNDWIF